MGCTMEFSEILTKLMADSDISNMALGKEVGVSYEAVRQWKTGKIVPSLDKASKVADYFHVTLDELAGRTPHTEQVIIMPILGSVSAGIMTHESQDGAYKGKKRKVMISEFRGRSPKECVLMEISGDSMEPMYHKGDIVIVHKQTEAFNGNIVVAYDPTEGGYTIKQFIKNADHVELRALNPKYKPFKYTNPDWQVLQIYGVCLGMLGKSFV